MRAQGTQAALASQNWLWPQVKWGWPLPVLAAPSGAGPLLPPRGCGGGGAGLWPSGSGPPPLYLGACGDALRLVLREMFPVGLHFCCLVARLPVGIQCLTTSAALRPLIRISQRPSLLILSVSFLSLSLCLLSSYVPSILFPPLLIQTLSFCFWSCLNKPQALAKD